MHLSSLLSHRDSVAIVSCLGKDQLGNEARRRMELKGVRTDYIQFHEDWDTGECFYLVGWPQVVVDLQSYLMFESNSQSWTIHQEWQLH
jgi:sugar/nucleoside kinase (ribokinase family)